MIDPQRFRILGAFLLVVALGASAACGSDDKTGVTSGAKPTSGSTPTEPTTSATGGAAVDSASLPAGFPTDDVPLLHEKVLTGSAGGPDGKFAWSAVLQSSRAVSDVSAEVRKDFAAAGYTAGPANELGDLSVLHFRSPRYDVGVTAARSEGHVIITYVVRKTS